MQLRNAWVAGAVGTALTVVVGQVLPAAVGIAAGAFAVFVVLWGREGYTRYALGGTVFALAVAVLSFAAFLPPGYRRTPGVALLGFGAVSGVLLLVRYLFKKGATKVGRTAVDEETAKSVSRAAGAAGGAIAMAWTVVTAQEKAARIGGIAGLSTVTLALNLLGVRIPFPIWFLESGIDANMVVFVGCVVTGFHTLESVHTTWRAVKRTGSASRDGASTVAGKAKAVTESAGDRVGSDGE